MKTKTASVRLPKEMFEEIDNICDGVGCSFMFFVLVVLVKKYGILLSSSCYRVMILGIKKL